MTLPLSHLRILDLTSNVSGPWCARLLATYGGDVLKVECPGTGDPSRGHGPFPGGVPHPEKSALFLWLNANKRGITCDIEMPSGRDLALCIAQHCDAVILDRRPSELERLRLTHDDFAAVNPRIVTTSVTAFGQSGPYSEWLRDEPHVVRQRRPALPHRRRRPRAAAERRLPGAVPGRRLGVRRDARRYLGRAQDRHR